MGTTKKSLRRDGAKPAATSKSTGKPTPATTSKAAAAPATTSKTAAAPAASRRRTSSRSKPTATAAGASPLAPLDAESAFEAARPEARALAAHEVKPHRGDSAVVVANVQRGTAAVLERVDELTKRFTPAEIAVARGLPARALAFSFAAAQVEASELGSDGNLGRQLVRARGLRRQLLRGAEACAEKGLVPAGEVAKIREGRGALDTAQDCVQLAAFYRRHAAALADKTPASAADVTEAATLGSELVSVLRPRSAAPTPRTTRQRREAADLRDRIWTLLVNDHEWLWKMGALLWGKAVDEHIPPLQSRVATPTGSSPEPAPAPTG